MTRHQLADEEWDCIADIFPAPAQTGRPPRDRRTILDAILWVMRTGSPWRDLPEEYQPWATVWDLFDKWNADGTLDEILHRLRACASTLARSTGSCGASMARSSERLAVLRAVGKKRSRGTC